MVIIWTYCNQVIQRKESEEQVLRRNDNPHARAESVQIDLVYIHQTHVLGYTIQQIKKRNIKLYKQRGTQ
jgi:hypothetical protein